MLRRLRLIAVTLVIALSIASATTSRAQKTPTIGFMQLSSHPALDAGRTGAVQALNTAGYIDGRTATFLFGNADGDLPTLTTIARKYVDQGVDMIIATGTQAK